MGLIGKGDLDRPLVQADALVGFGQDAQSVEVDVARHGPIARALDGVVEARDAQAALVIHG